MSFFDSTIGSIKSKISVDSKVNTSQNKYVVHSGDNLYRIAQNNNTTVDKLVELNNIDNPEVIDINQEIILPDKIITSETENTNDIYTVKNGDTLSKIAKENNTTVDELVRLNNIEDKDYIESGQQIKISQESITHSNNESNVISNNSTTNTETNQNISSSSSSTNIKNSGSIGNNSSQSGVGVASKTAGQFVNKIGDTIGNFANTVQQLFDNFSEEVSGEYKYDDQIGTIEEINLTADVDANVEKYNLFDLSWVRETDEFLINLLAQKTGQSKEYISTLFNYALDNGYFLSFAPVDLGNGNIQNVFTITDPYVLNSKGKSQQYICVEEKTDENGNKFYNEFPNEEGFKQWVDEIKNIQNSTLSTKKEAKNKCIGYDILLKNIEGFANNIEKYINELSDKPLFYFQNIKGTLVNIVQEIKFLSNNMQQEQAKNLENDANKIFNYFEKKVIPLADNISDDAKNELSHIKNSFFQLIDSLSKKKNIISNNSNNVEAKECTIPDINVDTATSDMSEKESYIYYTKIMKNILSQNNIQLKEDSTIFETVILFKDFITNNSSNLSESEIQNMTNFYNAILEEQIILLQTDKEIFTDFVDYLDVSDKQKEELYTEFERGNGIGAVTISQIWSLDEEIKKLEKKKYIPATTDAPWGGEMVVDVEDKEVSQQIQKLTGERYALSTQYKKQQFDYVINLRSSEEYKDATNREIPKYINSNGDECEINIELLEEQILSGLFQPVEIFSNIDENLGQDKILEVFEYLYEDVDFKNKILNGETATRENFFQHCFPGAYVDLQNKNSITYRIFTIMDDSQISDLIYLSKVEGSDRALQYIYSLEDDANKYYGQKQAEEEFNKILSGESPIEEVLKAFKISTVDGVQGYFNNLYITFSGDTTSTVQQYATQYFLQTITMSSMFVELDDNSIQELLDDKENPLDPEIATYLKTLEHPTELDILLKTGQITEEDYNFYLKLKDTEPYKKYIEELTNKSSQNKACIKYAYNVGLNVGNMLPSIASSAVFSIAGAPSVGQNIASLLMFGGAYGSAYQQGIQNGKSTSNAVIYALVSASSEVLTEKFLGRTPGISNAKAFIDASSQVVYTSYKSLIMGTIKTIAADLLCEVTEEEVQNIIEIIDDGYTGGTFDFSGLKEESIDTAIVTICSTLILGSATNTIDFANNAVNTKNLKNGSFSIKLNDGTVVPMTIDYLTNNGILDTKTKTINLEKLHDYFAQCKNNKINSIDNVTSAELRSIINQKLKERGINTPLSEITLMGYEDNKMAYGTEIANLIEQEQTITTNEMKKYQIKNNTINKINEVGTNFKSSVNTVKESIENIGTSLKEELTTNRKNVETIFSNVSSKMNGSISNLKTSMTELNSNLINGFKNIKEATNSFLKGLSPSTRREEFINFLKNIDYKNPNMYDTITELNKVATNPIGTYEQIKKIESKLNNIFSNQGISNYYKAAYSTLIRLTNSIKSPPTNKEIATFYKRFSNSTEYSVKTQNGTFSHIRSSKFPNGATKRLYINNINFSDTINFAMLFAQKCEERGIPFYFKTADMSNGVNSIKKGNFTRDESIVIYSNDKYIVDYLNICEEIREETQMEFNPPPGLTGAINDFIGYGDEPQNHDSYNEVRAKIITDALKETNNQYFGKEYNVEMEMKNLRKDSPKYKDYLTVLYNNIRKYSKINNVDVNAFFLNSNTNNDTNSKVNTEKIKNTSVETINAQNTNVSFSSKTEVENNINSDKINSVRDNLNSTISNISTLSEVQEFIDNNPRLLRNLIVEYNTTLFGNSIDEYNTTVLGSLIGKLKSEEVQEFIDKNPTLLGESIDKYSTTVLGRLIDKLKPEEVQEFIDKNPTLLEKSIDKYNTFTILSELIDKLKPEEVQEFIDKNPTLLGKIVNECYDTALQSLIWKLKSEDIPQFVNNNMELIKKNEVIGTIISKLEITDVPKLINYNSSFLNEIFEVSFGKKYSGAEILIEQFSKKFNLDEIMNLLTKLPIDFSLHTKIYEFLFEKINTLEELENFETTFQNLLHNKYYIRSEELQLKDFICIKKAILIEKNIKDLNEIANYINNIEDSSERQSVFDNLDGKLQCKLFNNYDLKVEFNPNKSIMAYASSFLVNNLEKTINKYFGKYFNVEDLNSRFSSYNVDLLSSERFIFQTNGRNLQGFNSAKGTTIKICDKPYLIHTIIHETIHEIARIIPSIGTGFDRDYLYSGINEACTDYFTNYALNDGKYKGRKAFKNGYFPAVNAVNKLIKAGIFNLDDLMKAYFNGNVDYLKKNIEKYNINFDEYMKSMSDGITDYDESLSLEDRIEAKNKMERLTDQLIVNKLLGNLKIINNNK